MVVVLPDPLGPKRPKTCPRCTCNERSLSATMSPYSFVRDVVSMTKLFVVMAAFRPGV